MKRWIGITGMVLGGLTFLTIFAYLAIAWSWNREFEKEVQALAQSGAKTDPRDFAPPPIPDSENAALVYAEAARILNPINNGKDRPDFTELLNEPIEWEAVSKEVTARREVLAKLREASQKPRCRYSVDYEIGFTIDLSQFPHLPATVAFARLLKTATLLAIHDRRFEEVPGFIEDNMALANSHRDDSMLVSQLIRSVTISYVFESLDADNMDLSPEGWNRLTNAFQTPPDLRSAFVHGLEMERALGIAMACGKGEVLIPPHVPRWIWLAGLRRSLKNYIRDMDRVISMVRLPFWDVRQDESDLRDELERTRKLYSLSGFLIPALLKVHATLATSEAHLAIMRTVCTLKGKGKYPDALEVQDPMSGKPLVYRREGAGFHLYSVGKNGVDDGGEADEHDYPKDDIGIRVTK